MSLGTDDVWWQTGGPQNLSAGLRYLYTKNLGTPSRETKEARPIWGRSTLLVIQSNSSYSGSQPFHATHSTWIYGKVKSL